MKKLIFIISILSIWLLPAMGWAAVGPNWIEQFGITWTFDDNIAEDTSAHYQYGQFVNGDYWVVNPDGGAVNVISISPPAVQVEQDSELFWMDGSQVNPSNLGLALLATGSKQSLDQRLENFWDINELITASEDSPYPMAPNTSLITAVSWRIDEDGAPSRFGSYHMLRPSLKKAAILTCLSEPPSGPSFRPAYCGTDTKVLHAFSEVDMSVLPELEATSEVPNLSLQENWDEWSNVASRPWLDYITSVWGQAMKPGEHMHYYGSVHTTAINDIILLTMLDSNAITPEQRQELAIHIIQVGIDNYGIIANGGGWGYIGGGSGHGRKAPVIYAAALLDYTDYKNVGVDYGVNWGDMSMMHRQFGEDAQKFHITQDDIDYFNAESRRATRTNCRVDASDPSLIIDDGGNPWYIADDGVSEIQSRHLRRNYDYWLIWNYGTDHEEYVRILGVSPFDVPQSGNVNPATDHIMRLRDPVTPGSGVTARVTLYPQARLGYPAWGGGTGQGGHWNNPDYDWYSRGYRVGNTGNSLVGAHLFALAVSCRDGTPLRTLWNWEPFFDYMDMYMDQTPVAINPDGSGESQILSYQRSFSSLAESMWDAYRADYPPVWSHSPHSGAADNGGQENPDDNTNDNNTNNDENSQSGEDDSNEGETLADGDRVIEQNLLRVQNNILKPDSTTPVMINCDIKEAGKLSVKIYDTKGMEIIVLADKHVEPGVEPLIWYGQDSGGDAVGSGVYLVYMQCGGYKETKKIAVIK